MTGELWALLEITDTITGRSTSAAVMHSIVDQVGDLLETPQLLDRAGRRLGSRLSCRRLQGASRGGTCSR